MNEIVIYQTPDNLTQIEVRFEEETVWLSQKKMADLFEKDSDTIGLHLKNIFAEGELDEAATTEQSSVVRTEGSRRVARKVKMYNLDAIIAVGYRVNSKRGTQFRQWATKRLRDYLVEGYAVNQRRLAERDLELTQLRDGISILRRAIATEAKDLSDARDLAALFERFTLGLALLYLIVKNHGFADGNKRIAAACFLYFLKKNNMFSAPDGGGIIDNDSLAALTLFTAVSKPEEMETVKKVIISVLNRKGSP